MTEVQTDIPRSLSFGDKEFKNFDQCLSVDRMRVDVELCGQCLIMYRRRFHIESVIATLQVISYQQ